MFKSLREVTKEKKEIDKEVVKRAKSLLIPSYFEKVIFKGLSDYYGNEKEFKYNNFIKCPIHNEDTPSFKYFEDTNTFYCFGCKSVGSVINLHIEYMKVMNQEEVTEEDAVEFINSIIDLHSDEVNLDLNKSKENKTDDNISKIRFSNKFFEINRKMYISKNKNKLDNYIKLGYVYNALKSEIISVKEAEEIVNTIKI